MVATGRSWMPQGESVGGDPTGRDSDTDGGQLSLRRPDPRQALLPGGGNPKMTQGLNQHFLQVPQVSVEVLPVRGEGKNGITYQLPRPMVRHISPSADFKEIDSSLFPLRVGEKDVVLQRGSPQGEDVGVFQKKKLIRNLPGPPPGHQLRLQIKGILIGDPAKAPDLQGRELLFRHPPGRSPSTL